MKHLLYSLLIFSLIACQTEEEVSPMSTSLETSDQKVNDKIPHNNKLAVHMREVHIIDEDPESPVNISCPFQGGSCFPIVVVEGAPDPGGISDSDRMKNIIDEIKESSQIEIQSLLANNEAFLLQYIEEDLLSAAINGNYTVLAPKGANPNQPFITFGTSGSLYDIYKACQFEVGE